MEIDPYVFTQKLKYIFLPFNDYPNRNGRIYNKDSFSNLNEIKQQIKDGKCFGEANHDYPNNDFNELSKISHKVTSIEITEKGLEGTVTILDTSRGGLIKPILDLLVIRPKMRLAVQNENGLALVEIKSFDFILKVYDGFNFNKRISLSKIKKKNSLS